jgi:hypothetical protein
VNIQTVVTPLKGIMGAIALDMNRAGLVDFKDCYRVQHAPRASLVEPINGDPFVNVLDLDTGEVVRHTFRPDNRASGTDKLRARILASKFFQEIAA